MSKKHYSDLVYQKFFEVSTYGLKNNFGIKTMSKIEKLKSKSKNILRKDKIKSLNNFSFLEIILYKLYRLYTKINKLKIIFK